LIRDFQNDHWNAPRNTVTRKKHSRRTSHR
jgi:hypothetical protein